MASLELGFSFFATTRRRDGPCQLFIRFEELQEVQHPNLACYLDLLLGRDNL
eukprot:symbB.v1.2.024901.t1/scaffold2381.1/size80542/7